MGDVDLSIVVPSYNEGKNLDLLLERFDGVINRDRMELIIVDNGSIDNSWEYLLEAKRRFKYLKPVRVEKNIGYGNGIVHGLKSAQGNVIAWTHADMQCDPSDVMQAYKLYLEKSSGVQEVFVQGCRINRKPGEKIFSLGMQILASIVLGTILTEVNAQPKLFPRSFLELMRDPPDDFSLDLYVLYLAKKKGYRLVSLPVDFKDRLYGEAKGGGSDFKTKWKLIKRTYKYIFDLKAKISKNGI